MPWSCRIPDGRILLEAFTPRACLEQYSYERLELLGDAFLKLAASLHLFRRFPRAHEGGQGPWPEQLLGLLGNSSAVWKSGAWRCDSCITATDEAHTQAQLSGQECKGCMWQQLLVVGRCE